MTLSAVSDRRRTRLAWTVARLGPGDGRRWSGLGAFIGGKSPNLSWSLRHPNVSSLTNRLLMASRCASLSIVWSAYEDDASSRPVEPGENAMPGLAPSPTPGPDPVELVVDGETFVVTRRVESPGTYDFAWTSHPESYGFTIGANVAWKPDQNELREAIRSFLAQVDPDTGYLPD